MKVTMLYSSSLRWAQFCYVRKVAMFNREGSLDGLNSVMHAKLQCHIVVSSDGLKWEKVPTFFCQLFLSIEEVENPNLPADFRKHVPKKTKNIRYLDAYVCNFGKVK